METKINISGFKCFNNDDFILKDITLMTGSNGAGKSSLIQAILLVRLAIEKNSKYFKERGFVLHDDDQDTLVPLNDGYRLKLGTLTDVFRETGDGKNEILIKLDEEIFKFGIPDIFEEVTALKPELTLREIGNIPFWRKREFYYLNTERLGPQHSLQMNTTQFLHCGFQGEFTAQVLIIVEQQIGFTSAMIDEKLRLAQEVNYWLDTICPGISVSAVNIGPLNATIKVRGNSNQSSMLATNIGYGISYALPIIVNGLIAQKDTVFIVENPEAHLHPKGQSNIGFFLGKLAEAGVKVIVETHSEHVVNGIRRAVFSSETMKESDALIYFFNGFDKNKKIIKQTIEIGSEGNLSAFPRDFFDQVNQDIAEIIKIKKKKNNG